jgi:hypothetical protein
MKFNILKLKSIALLVIICFSHVISLSLKKNKGAIDDFNNKLNNLSTNTQIVTLILGVLFIYDPSFNSVYEEFKTKDENFFSTNFGACINPSQSDLNSAKQTNVADVTFTLSAGWDSLNTDQKKEKCLKIQNTFKVYSKSEIKQGACEKSICKEILGYTLNTVNKIINFNLDDFTDGVSNFISDIANTFNYCEISDTKKKTILSNKWGTFNNYQNECNLFRDMDCNDPDTLQSTSFAALVKFIKKAQNFASYVTKVTDCIKKNPEMNKLLGNKLASLNFNLTSNMVDIFVNIITVGIWGTIKGSILILKMGILLGKIISDNTKQTAYHYGQLIGMGIRAAATIITGSKKKK